MTVDWNDPLTPTPSLAQYTELEKDDPDLLWKIGCGHHENLLDAALDEIERLQVERAEYAHPEPCMFSCGCIKAKDAEIDRLQLELYDREHENDQGSIMNQYDDLWIAMMKASSDPNGNAVVLGVYSTEELAQARCWRAQQRYPERCTVVFTMPLDADNEGDDILNFESVEAVYG